MGYALIATSNLLLSSAKILVFSSALQPPVRVEASAAGRKELVPPSWHEVTAGGLASPSLFQEVTSFSTTRATQFSLSRRRALLILAHGLCVLIIALLWDSHQPLLPLLEGEASPAG